MRADKVERIAQSIPDLVVEGDDHGDLLVLGWGSTLGTITGAVRDARKQGLKIGRSHLRYINPFPPNLAEVLGRFDKILVPEMNTGQLALLLRAHFMQELISYTKIQGKPFFRYEILQKIEETLGAARS